MEINLLAQPLNRCQRRWRRPTLVRRQVIGRQVKGLDKDLVLGGVNIDLVPYRGQFWQKMQ
jgi:hypothetical protein